MLLRTTAHFAELVQPQLRKLSPKDHEDVIEVANAGFYGAIMGGWIVGAAFGVFLCCVMRKKR